MMIYHIIPRLEWLAAQQQGSYTPPSLHNEGFIHCSTWDQVLRVADAFYREVPDLLLLCIDPARLQADLRWEAPAHPDGHDRPPTNDDEQFPHIYGALNLDAVVQTLPLKKKADGLHSLPEKPPDD